MEKKNNKIMTQYSSTLLQKIALVFLIVLGLYFAKDFLIPLCIGGILATLFLPFCNWMQNKKIPKGLAVFICFLSLVFIIAFLLSLIGWKLAELLNDLTLLKQKSLEVVNRLQKYVFEYLNITAEEQFVILKNEKPSFTNIFQVVILLKNRNNH